MVTKYRRCFVVLAVDLFLCLTVSAQTYRSPELRQRDLVKAYEQLLRARLFNLGGVGWGRQTTAEETALKTILESTAATTLLQRLIKEANPEGQLYALFGLRQISPEVFRDEAERLGKAPPERQDGLFPVPRGQVRVARGCLASAEDFEVAIDEIAKGKWDLFFKSSSSRWR